MYDSYVNGSREEYGLEVKVRLRTMLSRVTILVIPTYFSTTSRGATIQSATIIAIRLFLKGRVCHYVVLIGMIQRNLSLFLSTYGVDAFLDGCRTLSYVFLTYNGLQVFSISCYLGYDFCQGNMLLYVLCTFSTTSYVEVSLTSALTPGYMIISVYGSHVYVRAIREGRS